MWGAQVAGGIPGYVQPSEIKHEGIYFLNTSKVSSSTNKERGVRTDAY